jgi:DNA invertase Pin-like site-specific DNA recombinase
LSRDAHFLLGLQKAAIPFLAADNPNADALTVGFLALIAQNEREAISRRTKEALAAAKARGTRLGSRNGGAHLHGKGYHVRGVAAVKAKAQERATGLAATIAELRAEGVESANAIARELNARDYATPRGGKWTARSVLNVTARILASA